MLSKLKKLIGIKAPEGPAAPTQAEASGAGLIQAKDAYGRDVWFAREDWRISVLPGGIRRAWEDPDALGNLITQALKDGFTADVLEAARHLKAIDPNQERGAIILAVVLMELDQLDESEQVLSTYLALNHAPGLALTNLAKIYDRRGDHAKAQATLWQGLQADPNQEHGLEWYWAAERERGGETAGVQALERIAVLPNSWRARLWLARQALDQRDLCAALQHYQAAMGMTEALPPDAWMQITGDLGNHGHLQELVDLALPRFDAFTHGLLLGNNLIKALLDLRRPEEARNILEALYRQQRPDWRDTLQFWETRLEDQTHGFGKLTEHQPISMGIVTLEGPIWAREKEGWKDLLPTKAEDAPQIGFLAGTVTLPEDRTSGQVETQRANAEGVFSRALALHLAEQIHLKSTAKGVAIIPMIQAPHAGFALMGQAHDVPSLLQMASGCALAVSTHIDARTDEWKLTLTLASVSGQTIRTLSGQIHRNHPSAGLDLLVESLLTAILIQSGITRSPIPAWYHFPRGPEADRRLGSMEQTLAVICARTPETAGLHLYGERAILDGLLQAAADAPKDPVARLLLYTGLSRHRGTGSPVYREYEARIHLLEQEHRLPEPFPNLIQAAVATIFRP